MNKTILCCFLWFASFFIYAQNGDSLIVRAYYLSTFKPYKEANGVQTEEKVLDIGTSRSAFYGRWQRRREKITDSISARGGSYADILAAIGDLPSPRQFYAVYKNYPQKGTLTYTDRVLKSFYYQEPIDVPQWQPLPNDTIMAGYLCHAASCTFRGREWEVYYAPDIPISEGPWKLQGLPGLIVYACDKNGDFCFECIGLEAGKGESIDAPKLKSYMKCTRRELMQLHEESLRDPLTYVKKFGPATEGYGPDGKPLKYPSREPIFLEEP